MAHNLGASHNTHQVERFNPVELSNCDGHYRARMLTFGEDDGRESKERNTKMSFKSVLPTTLSVYTPIYYTRDA